MDQCPPLYSLTLDATEVQMIYESVRRVKPFSEMSEDMAEREDNLEARLTALVELVRLNS